MTPTATYTREEWLERWQPTPITEAFNDLVADLQDGDGTHDPADITVSMGVGIEAHVLVEGRAMTARILQQVVDDLLGGHLIWDRFPE